MFVPVQTAALTLLLCCAPCVPVNAAAPQRELTLAQNAVEFQAEFKKRSEQFVPISLAMHSGRDGKLRISAVWEKRDSGRMTVRLGVGRNDMQKLVADNARDGFRVQVLTSAGTAGRELYSGVWVKDVEEQEDVGEEESVRTEACFAVSGRELEQRHAELLEKKFAIRGVAAVKVDGKLRFSAAWVQATGRKRELKPGLSEPAFQREAAARRKKGERLIQAAPYFDGRRFQIAGVWDRSDGPQQEVRSRLTEAGLRSLHKEMLGKAFRPAFIGSYFDGREDRYIVVWEE